MASPQEENGYIDKGYILLSRKLLESQTWKACNHEQRAMLVTTLLKANHKDGSWWDGTEFIQVPRGSFITGRFEFAKETETTERKVRTFWDKMKRLGFLTIETTSKNSIITICKYQTYQNPELYERPTERPTERPSTDQAPSTNKNVKKVKNEKNYLAKEEIQKIIEEKLSRIATPALVKEVLLQIPEAMWWMVPAYLNVQYPNGGNSYELAENEIHKERQALINGI